MGGALLFVCLSVFRGLRVFWLNQLELQMILPKELAHRLPKVRAGLVVESVTTSESPVLYVFGVLVFVSS
jgi:hypothetical protein